MLLYLIRHADAVDLADDAARPLSRKGEQQVRTLAEFLGRSDAFQPREFWHSPLVRARQTAELLARGVSSTAVIQVVRGLQPEDDPRGVLTAIAAADHPLAIVGHEPHLSTFASLLVTGQAAPVSFLMKKCAVLALERAGRERWAVRWHVSPEILR